MNSFLKIKEEKTLILHFANGLQFVSELREIEKKG